MNINTSYTNLNNNILSSKKQSSLGLNIKSLENQNVGKKESIFSQKAVIVETGDSKLLGSDEDMFDMLNQGRTWTIDGNEVAYKDLDKDTRTFLCELDKTQKEFLKNNKATDYAGLTADLGNTYAKKRDELSEKYTGDELTEKLKVLEKSFNMYTETKVIGNKLEFGSIAHRTHWSMLNARSDKYRAEKRQAYLDGKNPTEVKKQDLTKNDDEFISDLLSNSKKLFTNVTEYFNKNGVIKNSVELKNLYSLVGDNNAENSWSLGKLSATFDILENVAGANKERYKKEEFEQLFESNDFKNMFSKDEQGLFKDIYGIYK